MLLQFILFKLKLFFILSVGLDILLFLFYILGYLSLQASLKEIHISFEFLLKFYNLRICESFRVLFVVGIDLC